MADDYVEGVEAEPGQQPNRATSLMKIPVLNSSKGISNAFGSEDMKVDKKVMQSMQMNLRSKSPLSKHEIKSSQEETQPKYRSQLREINSDFNRKI